MNKSFNFTIEESLKRKSLVFLIKEARDTPESEIGKRKKVLKALKELNVALKDANVSGTHAALSKGIQKFSNNITNDEIANVFVSIIPVFLSAFSNFVNELNDLIEIPSSNADQTIPYAIKEQDVDVEETLKGLISRSFKPTPGLFKLLKQKSSVWKSAIDSIEKAKDIVANVKASESVIHDSSMLNEGILDFLKDFFTTSSDNPSSAVKSLLPLFDGKAIHKLLFNDLMRNGESVRVVTVGGLKEIQEKINTIFVPLALPTRTLETSSKGTETGSDTPGGDASGGDSVPSRTTDSSSTTPSETPDKKKSLSNIVGLDSASPDAKTKLKDAVHNSEVKVNITTGETGIANDNDKKNKLGSELEKIETEFAKAVKDKLRNTYTENSQKEEDVLLERWQKLAGIIK